MDVSIAKEKKLNRVRYTEGWVSVGVRQECKGSGRTMKERGGGGEKGDEIGDRGRREERGGTPRETRLRRAG